MTVEITKAWVYKGRHCIILWVGSHYCGYGETKLKCGYSHTATGLEYDGTSPESCVTAHGGLTFSGPLDITPFDKDIYYFGMDYAHAGDYMEYDCVSLREGKKWTIEEVEKDVEAMIDSIIEYEQKYVKIRELFEEYKNKIKILLEEIKNDTHT